MERLSFDVAVIGGGVVGLAVARNEAMSGSRVVLVEKESVLGSETSSRNSEVIHAGIYYENGSLKHKLCVEGRELLYDYLYQKGVSFRKTGKIIFCSKKDDLENLENIRKNAEKNGVFLEYCSKKRLNPVIGLCNPYEGLWSPETGIFDSHQYFRNLAFDFEEHAGMISLNTNVNSIYVCENKININCTTGNQDFVIETEKAYNAAGLHSLDLAVDNNLTDLKDIKNYYVKGHYYSYYKKIDFPHLLYPMPNKLGLGMHLTFDLNGACRFGPDTFPLGDKYNYKNEVEDKTFADQVTENFPGIVTDHLNQSYTGIRPKIKFGSNVCMDFIIEKVKNINFVNFLGIESPGLTASLAIAKYAKNLIEERL